MLCRNQWSATVNIFLHPKICAETAERNIFDRLSTLENGIQIIQWHHQFDQKLLLTNKIMHLYVYFVYGESLKNACSQLVKYSLNCLISEII